MVPGIDGIYATVILPAILSTLKGKLLLGFWTIAATVAVTEAFLGQLMIAVVVALIGATPPTIAIILMAKKQSAERAAGNKELLEGQEKMSKAVDGQLSKLVEAKEQLGRAAGKEEARVEARVRQGEAAIAKQSEGPQPVIVENDPDKPVIVKQADAIINKP